LELGVYGSGSREVLVTEEFVYELYRDVSGNFGVRLYVRDGDARRVIALCEVEAATLVTRYAFESELRVALGNDAEFKRVIESRAVFDESALEGLERIETFALAEGGIEALPYYDGTNTRECLRTWRQGSKFSSWHSGLLFTCVTCGIEYVCQIGTEMDNIYCGASISIPANGGMVGGNQYFRIRNYGDNSEPWCQKFCNLGWEKVYDREIDESLFTAGVCNITQGGDIYWGVKSWNSEVIILEGCDGDEYTYMRDAAMSERFI
jgi:hypothetical protein